jgi:hypothetical protein
MSTYLFLSCEGWVRFGPFRWIRFVDDERVIKNDNGEVIASFNGSHWTATAPQYAGFHFIDPFITSTKRHPHPNHG